MTRYSLIRTLILSLLFLTASAGAAVGDSPALDVHAGMSLSTINAPSNVTTSDITGHAAGIGVEVPLGTTLFLQPEATFVKRGAKLVDAGNIGVNAVYYSIEVPVLLKAKFGEVVRPFVFAGPNFIFNVSNSVEGTVAGQTGSVNFEPNTMDMAATFGGGVEFSSFFLSLRYQVGFVELNKNSASWSSRGFLFLAGFRV